MIKKGDSFDANLFRAILVILSKFGVLHSIIAGGSPK
jgi:hypothetical protein